jgi:hypothetical protein
MLEEVVYIATIMQWSVNNILRAHIAGIREDPNWNPLLNFVAISVGHAADSSGSWYRWTSEDILRRL